MSSYVRKFEKAKNAAYDPRFGRALRIAHQAWIGPQYEEIDGFRVRVWGDPNEDWVRVEDVKRWLKGLRVVEDLRDGLEYVRESYIQMMVREGYLRKDAKASYYWITRKAAERFDLDEVMGCKFPK